MMRLILNRGFYCGFNGGGWFAMMLLGLLVIGLIVYLVYKLPKKDEPKKYDGVNESLNVLNLRFAKGKISEEEYRVRKEAILK